MEKEQLVLQRLIELFGLCLAAKYAQAAPYIIYKGPDKTREYQDLADYSKPHDQRLIESLCNRIKGFLEASDNHEFGEFQTVLQPVGEWCAWEVFFHKGNERKVRYFGFLKVKGTYALGDINR